MLETALDIAADDLKRRHSIVFDNLWPMEEYTGCKLVGKATNKRAESKRRLILRAVNSIFRHWIAATFEFTMAVHDGVPMMHRPLYITKLANQGNNSASYVEDHVKDVIGRFDRNVCVCKLGKSLLRKSSYPRGIIVGIHNFLWRLERLLDTLRNLVVNRNIHLALCEWTIVVENVLLSRIILIQNSSLLMFRKLIKFIASNDCTRV